MENTIKFVLIVLVASLVSSSITASITYYNTNDECGNKINVYASIISDYQKSYTELSSNYSELLSKYNALANNNTKNQKNIETGVAKNEKVIDYKKICNDKIDLGYQRYINPKHPKIVELARQLKGNNFHEDMYNVQEWVLTHINTDTLYYNSRTIDQVLMDGKGDCSEVNMMFVSIMRAMGYNETYVIIARTNNQRLNTKYSGMKHAYSIVFYNNKTYTFYDIPDYNVLMYMYNDEKAFRCK